MGTLLLRCPKTGHNIDTGIETAPESLHGVLKEFVRVFCPECGETHSLPLRSGEIYEANALKVFAAVDPGSR
jgi:hypothetical protein